MIACAAFFVLLVASCVAQPCDTTVYDVVCCNTGLQYNNQCLANRDKWFNCPRGHCAHSCLENNPVCCPGELQFQNKCLGDRQGYLNCPWGRCRAPQPPTNSCRQLPRDPVCCSNGPVPNAKKVFWNRCDGYSNNWYSCKKVHNGQC